MEQLLQVIPKEETAIERPSAMIALATEQAKALVDLIEKQKLYVSISGRKYVKVEGWTPLARMNNVIPREVENIAHEDGHYVARVQLVRLTDGLVLTEASGECGGPNEDLWQKRAPYARRSMAATRATGKACRIAFSWIMALGGYEPTPAEEMPENDEKPKAVKRDERVEGPDTFWRFLSKKDNKPTIGIHEGQKLSAVYLVDLGAREWPKGSRVWYLDDTGDNFKKLTEAKNVVL